MSSLHKKCIASWKEHFLDYQIIKWTESNTNLTNNFVKKAYSLQKYAFVADYVRFKVLHDYGGIYLDTDMLVLKPFDDLLYERVFVGQESSKKLNGAIIGAESKHKFVKDCLDFYNGYLDFTDPSKLAIPGIMTKIANENSDITIYEPEYFYSFPFEESIKMKDSYTSYITEKSFAVHLWEASWLEEIKKARFDNKYPFISFLMSLLKGINKSR